MTVEFHKNCENTGKMPKISSVRCNFVKFDFHFLGLPSENYFGVTTDDYTLQKCKKECNIL